MERKAFQKPQQKFSRGTLAKSVVLRTKTQLNWVLHNETKLENFAEIFRRKIIQNRMLNFSRKKISWIFFVHKSVAFKSQDSMES